MANPRKFTLTKDDIKIIGSMRKEGHTWAEIGHSFNTSPSNISRQYKKWKEIYESVK